MRRLTLLCLGVFLYLGACGYHLPGRGNALPEDVQTVYVEPFKNKTTEPFLETPLTNEVRDQFSRRRTLEVVGSPDQADAILTGTIVSYRVSTVSYDSDDDITEYRAVMTVDTALTRANGEEVIWRRTVSWREEFYASDDRARQDYSETLAQEDLHRRLAQEIYNSLTDNF